MWCSVGHLAVGGEDDVQAIVVQVRGWQVRQEVVAKEEATYAEQARSVAQYRYRLGWPTSER